MQRIFRKFTAILLASALCLGLFGIVPVWAESNLNDIIITDEESGELSPQQEFCTEITTEKVKVGQKSYRSTTAAGSEDGSGSSSEHWLFRSGNSSGGLLRTLDVSDMIENGAVRFWIYIEDTATLHNWNGSQVQFGSDGWDRNTFAWSDWHKQIVNDGWNEIILPFSDAGTIGGEVNTTAMTWFFIRTNNVQYKTTVYLDNIRVTADCIPEETDIVLATAEWGNEIPGTEFCANPSDEKAAVGKYSYKATPGIVGNTDHWILRGYMNTIDISNVTNNATTGALRFKIYVEDILTVNNWNGSQVQFGSGGWDNNTFIWSDIHKQIKRNGWNEIILPFANAGKIGEVDASLMTWFFIRTNNPEYYTVIYVDDIRVTADSNIRSDSVILANAELENEIDGTGFCAGRSDEKAASGKYSYKATPGIVGSSDHWILRGNIPPVNISELTTNGTDGALRFMIYVENISTVTNWGKFVVQFGSGYWDTNVYQWQPIFLITKNGWNEIVLPFSEASTIGTPDLNAVTHINMRTDNVSYTTTVYVDDICVTSDTSESNDVKLFNDELYNSTVEGAELVTENPYSGDKSLKSVLDNEGSQKYIFSTMLDKKYNLSKLSDNGTDGALRFKFYVEDTSLISDLNSVVSLKSTSVDSKFTWVDWENQITENGWNDIVLPINTAVISNGQGDTPLSADIIYSIDNISIEILSGADATVYLDDFRFESHKTGDINSDYNINSMDYVVLKKIMFDMINSNKYSDVNGDGNTDVLDLIWLKNLLIS